jgi:hypothetical protein
MNTETRPSWRLHKARVYTPWVELTGSQLRVAYGQTWLVVGGASVAASFNRPHTHWGGARKLAQEVDCAKGGQ